jgi:hypothetical protein
MAGEDFKIEDRFSRSRGLFPYVVGIIGLVVVVVIVMILTGKGLSHLPFGEYFAVHAPTAPNGTEALSLQSLKHTTDEKTTLSIEGTVMNRTDRKISGLVAVIAVTDRFTLPVATVNVPIEPTDLEPMKIGTFNTTVMLGENGLGTYNLQFRLPNEGPFVPHKDDRPPEPIGEPEAQPIPLPVK